MCIFLFYFRVLYITDIDLSVSTTTANLLAVDMVMDYDSCVYVWHSSYAWGRLWNRREKTKGVLYLRLSVRHRSTTVRVQHVGTVLRGGMTPLRSNDGRHTYVQDMLTCVACFVWESLAVAHSVA